MDTIVLDTINWIQSNIQLMTLLLATLFSVLSLFLSALSLLGIVINRKSLRLSSQPTLKMVVSRIDIVPHIPASADTRSFPGSLRSQRRWFSMAVSTSNIGSHPAQDIYVDAMIEFKTRKPIGYSSLPVLHPHTEAFISNSEQDSKIEFTLSFDNYIVPEIVADFFEGRAHFDGFPFLPRKRDIRKKSLWPSPRITVKCFYKDIQGNNYCAETHHFFHLWRNAEEGKIDGYLLNVERTMQGRISRTSNRRRSQWINRNRPLRYASFDGEKYTKRDLQLLAISREAERGSGLTDQSASKSKVQSIESDAQSDEP